MLLSHTLINLSAKLATQAQRFEYVSDAYSCRTIRKHCVLISVKVWMMSYNQTTYNLRSLQTSISPTFKPEIAFVKHKTDVFSPRGPECRDLYRDTSEPLVAVGNEIKG